MLPEWPIDLIFEFNPFCLGQSHQFSQTFATPLCFAVYCGRVAQIAAGIGDTCRSIDPDE